MVEDFECNLDMLLKHGFVEANNRLDAYSSNVDLVKITNYGLYMGKELAHYFTYLDLVCTDTGIYTEKTSNYLSEAARKEYSLFNRGERVERVKIRLERVGVFIGYLKEEEERERDIYSLDMPVGEMFSYKAEQEFKIEKMRVLKSAKRQNNKSSNGIKRTR